MTEDTKPKKEKNPKTGCKITLTKEASDKLSLWLNHVDADLKGVKLNRSTLTSWFIAQAPDVLNSSQTEKLVSDFRSEVARAKWISREIERLHIAGETVTIEEFLKSKLGGTNNASVRPRKQSKRKQNTKDTASENEADTKIDGSTHDHSDKPIYGTSEGGF